MVWRGGWASTTVVGDAVECGDCADTGELFELCPHGDNASLGVVVFWVPLLAATEPAVAADDKEGIGEVTDGGAEVG